MSSYKLRKRALETVSKESINRIFDNSEKGTIGSYTWDVNGYKPKTIFKLFYTEEHIHVMFRVSEVKAEPVYSIDQSPVYKDSCVEFFVGLKNEPKSEYMNFEMNANGILLLGYGNNYSQRESVSFDRAELMIRTETSEPNRDEPYWQVTYAIPVSLLRKLDPQLELKSGLGLKANFYKCGDDTKFPHYGSWMPIKFDTPKFHLPEFFGDIVLG